MNDLKQFSKDYYRIEKAICFIDENFKNQPTLKEMAEAAGISRFHFQRIFQRWAGISPKKFLQFLTKEYAKQLLKESNLLETSYEAGLSGPGRLHDLFVTCEGMSPGEYKDGGQGLKIDYGFHPTPFGEAFMALTDRGICGLSFINEPDAEKTIKKFQQDWSKAKLNFNQARVKDHIESIFPSAIKSKKTSIKLLCRGTNFQIKVWEALLRIPSGCVVTYKTVAEGIQCPKAVRAVGNAIGRNPIAYLIPCHRVIRGAGHFGGYRWGMSRKKAILALEAKKHNAGTVD